MALLAVSAFFFSQFYYSRRLRVSYQTVAHFQHYVAFAFPILLLVVLLLHRFIAVIHFSLSDPFSNLLFLLLVLFLVILFSIPASLLDDSRLFLFNFLLLSLHLVLFALEFLLINIHIDFSHCSPSPSRQCLASIELYRFSFVLATSLLSVAVVIK